MGNIIKYSTTSVANTINKGNFYLGVNGNTGGPTDITGFWNGIQPPLGGYTLYGNKNDAFGPSINVFNNDAELISFVNQRGGNVSTIFEAINYFSSNDELILVDKDYEPIVTDGLVLNLDASFTPSYSRTETTWNDISGNGNNGTLINGPVFSGGSISFDGVDDRVNVPHISSYNLSTLTVLVWVKPTSPYTGSFRNLISKQGVDRDWNFYLYSSLSNGVVNYYHFSTARASSYQSISLIPGGSLSLDVWHQCGFSISNGVLKYYLDGNVISSGGTNFSSADSSYPISIGGTDYYTKGDIMTSQIYNRGLTNQEVLQNYQVMLSRFTGDNIIMNGLVLYLDAGYNGSYIGSGTTWNDISGYGNHGTLVNGVTYSSLNGGSLLFDGVDDYVNTITATSLGINLASNPFTISVWFKTTSTTEHYLFDNYNGVISGINVNISLRTQDGKLEVNIAPNTSGVIETQFGSGYNNNIWHDFTITWNGSNLLTVYGDSINIGNNTTVLLGSFETNAAFRIGSRPVSGNFFNGNISKVSVYNRALSASEVLQSYQTILPRYTGNDIIMDGLVLYLDAGYNGSYIGSGTTWNDISGYGNNVALINGVTYSTDNGGSLSFDGTDDYVERSGIPIDSSISFTNGNFTLEHWIKPTGYEPGVYFGLTNMIMSKGPAGTYNYATQVSNSTTLSFIHRNNAEGLIYLNFTVPTLTNVITQVVFVITLTQVSLYINGNLSSTQNLTGNPITPYNNDPLYIGGLSSTPNTSFVGNMYGHKIYNRALSDSEILQNFNATKSRYVLYKNAYEIKQANPNSPSGIYTISNPGINGGAPTQIYADMETDGGGWTLIMTNSSYLGWTYENSISRNITSPSVATNYSIIGYADALKRSSSGFQYMIDANTRGSWGGIWTANGLYSFTSPLNTNTNITLNTKFGTWVYEDNGVEERMPWYSNTSGFITTSVSADGNWWGTLITAGSGWSPAPWMANGMGYPGIIWYWVR